MRPLQRPVLYSTVLISVRVRVRAIVIAPRRFYNLLPNGSATVNATGDENTLHAGCPVRSGVKWAANIWLWNGVPTEGLQKHTVALSDGRTMSMLARTKEEAQKNADKLSAAERGEL